MNLSQSITTSMLALTIIFGSTSFSHAQTTFKLGDTIPENIPLTLANGEKTTLGAYRGQPTVLEWTNYQCPFVQKHYSSGNMQNLQATYTAKGVKWLSVISSAEGKQGYLNPKTAATDVSKANFKGTAVALDPTGTLGKQFGAETTPHMYILNAEGELVYMGAIDSIPSFNKDDITKAENYVTKALDEILAGKPVTTTQTRSYGCSVKY